jgi:hypothetical protein
MGAVIEVKYFNTFLLKKITNGQNKATWNGSFGIPEAIGGYPSPDTAGTNLINNWVIEESRITGGFNNTSVDFGVRAYLVEDEADALIRGNSMIYSGVFNSRTGINNTNVFSIGEDISKSVDPANGTIQKLYAEDTALIILQEQKVSRGPIDKDVIYSAEGGGTLTASNKIIGDIMPYSGNYGISKNPESFAVYGYRKYFTDKNNNVVVRLSQDGLTEVSAYGMIDYFRDELGALDTDAWIGKVVGGWDIHNKQYVVSMQRNINGPTGDYYNTLAFDEQALGWPSFFTYKPDHIFSLKNNFYSLKDGAIWLHYSNDADRGDFYGVHSATSVTFVFNQAVSLSKNFQTVNYEGSNGWQIDAFDSDPTGEDLYDGQYRTSYDVTKNTLLYPFVSVLSYDEGAYDNYGNSPPLYQPVNRAGFDRKENKYFASLINRSSANPGEVIFGSTMSGIKGYFATVTIATDATTNQGGAKELFAVSTNYSNSSY